MNINTSEKLLHIIKSNDYNALSLLLNHNNEDLNFLLDNKISLLGYSIDMLEQGGSSLAIIILLLKHGANPNIDNELISAISNGCNDDKTYINIIILLLLYGADPNLYYEEEDTVPIKFADDNILNNINILLNFGALAQINNKNISYNSLIHSIIFPNNNSLKLLLDNGADPAISDEYGESMLVVLEKNKEKYSQENYRTLQQLLNPNNPPYLKLGELDADKYIIYENVQTSQGVEPYLLTDKNVYKNKKYLYADNKSDTFVYWAYTKNLLEEHVMKKVEDYLDIKDIKDTNVLDTFITKTIGHELTTDHFNDKGKKFASSYLTVTHWWYNLHTDFNRLYQDKNIKLPRAIKSQKEFDTLMRLLDIRYEQFKSKKDFNSNQNKAELEALIEGKEPPKRVIDLSFLD